MNHAEVHSYMAEYLEGELDLTKRALLDAHLDACDSCSGEFADMRGTISLLRGLPDPEPPPFLVENVMRRVRDGEGHYSFFDRLRDWVGYVATPQVALPAAALGLGLMMATGNLDPGALTFPGSQRSPQVADTTERAERPAVQPPQFAATSRPPAVARTPRVTITLPGSGQGALLSHVASDTGGASAANASAGNSRSMGPYFARRAPRSIRGVVPPLAGTSPGLSTTVANRVAPGTSAFAADGDSTGLSPEERRARELDERLARMIRNPAAFSAEFARQAVAEQEIWLSALAERARETGRGQEAVAVLRGAGDRSALELATAFSVELQQ